MSGALPAVLAGTSSGPVFVPWLWELAAERAGLSLAEMTASATSLVDAVTNAARLVESDVLTVLVDEAGGVTAEALSRLAASSPYDVVAVVPGPAALAARLGLDDPDDRDEAAEDLARAVLETRPAVLAVDEPAPDPDTAVCYRAIARLAVYYGIRTLVIGPPAAAFAVDAGIDAHLPPDGSPEGNIVTTSWISRPTGADADAVRAVAARIRAAREEAPTCP